MAVTFLFGKVRRERRRGIEISAKIQADSAGSSEKKKKITGKVVGIIQRNWRQYVATVQLENQVEKKEWVLCVPMDYRIPKIRIRSRQVSEILNSRWETSGKFRWKFRLVLRIDSWDASSHYPNGHYVTQLGEIGKLDTETNVKYLKNISQISHKYPKKYLWNYQKISEIF
jgi:DIS3-like exonuclease 1